MKKQIYNRIDVADVLRGLSVMGIILLHSIEHFNFYFFPQIDNLWLQFSNQAIWNSLFFVLGGKAYAIFALLFGFSFFIQDNNTTARGGDFRLRFMWRLVLLFLIGQLNASFFTGEVLVLYAMMGFVLPLFARASNKIVLFAMILLFLQPIEIGKLIYALINPDYVEASSLDSYFWGKTGEVQQNGTFWETVKVNLWEGQLASLSWAWNNARCFHTPALFLLGMLIGRKNLFMESKENLRFWGIVLAVSIVCFFPLNGLSSMLPDYIENKAVLRPLSLLVVSSAKVAFTFFLVSGIILIYYLSSLKSLLNKVMPYGRMSLTNYVTQSIIGSFIFYHWGLNLKWCTTYSVMLGMAILVIQYTFCYYWMKGHKHGPLEYVWKKATWICSKNNQLK